MKKLQLGAAMACIAALFASPAFAYAIAQSGGPPPRIEEAVSDCHDELIAQAYPHIDPEHTFMLKGCLFSMLGMSVSADLLESLAATMDLAANPGEAADVCERWVAQRYAPEQAALADRGLVFSNMNMLQQFCINTELRPITLSKSP